MNTKERGTTDPHSNPDLPRKSTTLLPLFSWQNKSKAYILQWATSPGCAGWPNRPFASLTSDSVQRIQTCDSRHQAEQAVTWLEPKDLQIFPQCPVPYRKHTMQRKKRMCSRQEHEPGDCMPAWSLGSRLRGQGVERNCKLGTLQIGAGSDSHHSHLQYLAAARPNTFISPALLSWAVWAGSIFAVEGLQVAAHRREALLMGAGSCPSAEPGPQGDAGTVSPWCCFLQRAVRGGTSTQRISPCRGFPGTPNKARPTQLHPSPLQKLEGGWTLPTSKARSEISDHFQYKLRIHLRSALVFLSCHLQFKIIY